MGTWEELKVAISALRDDPRRPLRSYPGLSVDEHRTPPFRIALAAWASEIASDLEARFGSDVNLTVGALHFPDGMVRNPDGSIRERRPPESLPRLDPGEVEIALASDVLVRSGFDARSEVLVRNRGVRQLAIHTNGTLTARVVDPTSGEIVGGFAGAQTLPLVTFRAAPGEIVTVPLLVGTASFVPELGYAIPAGSWSMDAIVDLGDDGRYLTPHLPLAVKPQGQAPG